MFQCGYTYTAKLYNHTIPNKRSQVLDLPASTFEGLRYRVIGTVTINTKLKVRKLKDIHYNHQTLCIHTKIGSVTTITSPKHSCLQEINHFCYKVVPYLQ